MLLLERSSHQEKKRPSARRPEVLVATRNECHPHPRLLDPTAKSLWPLCHKPSFEATQQLSTLPPSRNGCTLVRSSAEALRDLRVCEPQKAPACADCYDSGLNQLNKPYTAYTHAESHVFNACMLKHPTSHVSLALMSTPACCIGPSMPNPRVAKPFLKLHPCCTVASVSVPDMQPF